MNTELRNRRRTPAATGLIAIVFFFGAALVARATMTALPHQTLYGVAGQDTHGIVAAWTSSHNGNHFTATINWGDATLATTGAVSSNGQKSFDTQGTHVFDAPGTYTGNVAVFDPVDNSSVNIGFTSEIRPTGLQPMALAVDETSNAGTNSDLDRVFEFGETVVMNPTWTTATENLSSVSSAIAGFHRVGQTAGEAYVIEKATADYGSIAKNDVHDTFDGNDSPHGYLLTATLTGPRPNPHMDALVTETLIGQAPKVWTLHMGRTFSDVSPSSIFYANIETIVHNGVTLGLTPTLFGPQANATRGQMAAFLARGFKGGDASVPAAGTVNAAPYDCTAGGVSLFTDVAPTGVFCKHIHYIASLGITVGVGGGMYAPTATITRGEAGVFLARSQPPNHPGLEGDVPTAYSDPNTGRSYDCSAGPVPFSDVSTSHPFCKYISYIWAKGIVDGFGDGTYRPTNFITREQMAKLLNVGLELTLYHP